jgi:hypothetical protein
MAGTDEKTAVVAKYRATPRFKQALKIIAPDASRRAECERGLVEALRTIEDAARVEKSEQAAAEQRKLLQQLAKTLRRAIKLAGQARREEYKPRPTPWDSRIDGLKCFLMETENAADYCSRFEVSKGAPRRSNTRIAAVWQAYILLEKYGKRPPGFSREGPWHKLARVLLGNQQADLFDYMQTRHKLNQPLVG